MHPWDVKFVEVHPAKYKVYPKSFYKETNDVSNYFSDLKVATKEAEKRNREHDKLIKSFE